MDAPPHAEPRHTGRGREAARTAAWSLLLLGVAALLHLLPRHPYDADTAYHVAVARLTRAHGVLHAFPWTPFSWLADHYADKELAFHLLLVPFTGLDWATAARIVGTLASGAALAAGYAVLRAERVGRAELWSLLPLAASGVFAFRLALVRPHLLSIALALVVAWAASRRRLAVLALASFVYPLAYVGWPIALGLGLVIEASRLACGERPGWKAPAVIAVGLAAGLLVHPNFPEIARFAWIVNAGILLETAWAARQGFELGQEFEPLGGADALRHLLVPALLTAAAWGLAWRRRREDTVPLALAACAAVLLGLTLRTARFAEYAVPFAAVAAALAARRAQVPAAVPALVLAGAFAFTAAFGSGPVRALGARGEDVPAPFAEVFRQTVPEGAQVFTCEWGLTGTLMLALPERRFLVALDPVLFWKKDPGRYATWRRLTREGGSGAAEEIRGTFGARFVLCTASPGNAPLLRSLTADPSVLRVLKSPLWFLYDLAPPR